MTAEERAAAEAGLVARAVQGMDAKGLRRAARRMLDKAADVTREQVDAHEADQLQREEQRAERETNLAMWENGDGTWSGKFTIPDLHASLLKAYLERLCSPSRLATNNAGETVADVTVATGVNSYEQRGRAFCELIEHLPGDGFGRGGIGVMVHLDYSPPPRPAGLRAARHRRRHHPRRGPPPRLRCGDHPHRPRRRLRSSSTSAAANDSTPQPDPRPVRAA